MNGTYLRFYVQEKRQHGHVLLYEWLLEQAKEIGIPGGTAFRAIAGYGRHGKLHEQHFFELAGDLPVEVEFLLDETQAEALMELVRRERLRVVWVKEPVEYGLIDGGD